MAATQTKTGIEKISTVIVVTENTDEAIDFYVEKLGFEKTTDTPFGPPDSQMRWVEVSVPGAETTVALAPPPPDYGEVGGAQTGIALSSDDIDATFAALKDAGVDVDDEVSRMGAPVPPMFWFRDLEGNSLMVVETSE
jgi:catechol 2,3-dioxygenase-like lactoylglutathione lyase family enzyme